MNTKAGFAKVGGVGVVGALSLAMALGAIACSSKKSDPGDDIGTQLGNAMVLSMAKDQYAKAKSAYDSGGDATGECIMDTAELRKDKSAEAQKLANDTDALCVVSVPARSLEKQLADELATVTADRSGKGDMLAADQVVLSGTCDDIAAALKDMTTKGLAAQPDAKTLQSKHDAACTPDNLTGGVVKAGKHK